MDNFLLIPLSDIADIVMGQSPSNEECNNNGIGMPLLNGPTEFTDEFPVAVQYTTKALRQAQEGDILFCVRGSTTGKMNWADKPYAIGRGLAAIRHKEGNEYNRFIKALLDYNMTTLLSFSTGTTFPNVGKEVLHNLKVLVPNIKEQQKISDILTIYDAKISNCKKHILELDMLVQTLYQNWFSNFNYPDATGEMLDGIPIGWTKSSVFDNVTEVREKNQDDLDYPVLSVVKEGEFKLSDDVFTKQVYSKSLTNYKIVRRNQVGYNPARANIGSIAMLTDFDIGLVSPVYVVLEMKDTITPTFFYYYMKQPMFAEGIKHHAIGTTRQNFPFEAFKMFPMIIPPMELQKRFEEIAKPIEQKIAKLKEENAVLAEIRDTLLPKLMSGELPVEMGDV